MAVDNTRLASASEGLKSDRSETYKVLGFAVIIVLIYFCAEAIGTSLQAARSSIADLNTSILITCFGLAMLISYRLELSLVVVLVDKFSPARDFVADT